MRVLILGKGGREHGLAWKIACSPRAGRVFVAPGNAGTEGGPGGKIASVFLDLDDFEAITKFARAENIGLTVVGPEEPLARGIVDALEKSKLRVFGPVKSAAQLEGSKVFCKELMRQAGVPTADFKVCDHPQIAKTYIDSRDYSLVVKANGLAGGKGVIVCNTREDAYRAVDRLMVRGEFGAQLLVAHLRAQRQPGVSLHRPPAPRRLARRGCATPSRLAATWPSSCRPPRLPRCGASYPRRFRSPQPATQPPPQRQRQPLPRRALPSAALHSYSLRPNATGSTSAAPCAARPRPSSARAAT